jgi:2-amino-4-hydroxy-6-hydroxymethyldihydropteridine diphosphokinase
LSVVYLGLGSNVGDRAGYLHAALLWLAGSGVITITAVSSLYETAPMEITDQPAFLNAVAAGQTSLAPLDLLRLLKDVERAVGRVQRVRYGPREVDLDILVYDDMVLASEELAIPHPSLRDRAFALVPLNEVAPGLVLPGSGEAIATLIPDALASAGGAVAPVQPSTWWP